MKTRKLGRNLTVSEIGLVPYRPLARGFLTGASDGMYLNDTKNTRFDEKNLAANMALKNFVQDLADQKNVMILKAITVKV